MYQRGNNPECIYRLDCLSIRPMRVFDESQIDTRGSMNCIGCKDYKPKEIKNEDDIKQYCSIFRRHIDLDFACKYGEIKESDENTIVRKDILTDNDKKILAVICLRHGILKKDIISIQADYDGYLYIHYLYYSIDKNMLRINVVDYLKSLETISSEDVPEKEILNPEVYMMKKHFCNLINENYNIAELDLSDVNW